MAIQTINLGTYANDGTGDDLRTAFEKVNNNIDYLSNLSASGGANLGAGAPVYYGKSSGNLQFRSIAAGTNIAVSYNDTAITVSTSGTISANLTGNVTGNVTGNLTGNVTGNLTGNVTGNLTGNVTGQVSDITNHTLEELSNVAGTLPSDGQALVYSLGSWGPATIATDLLVSDESTILTTSATSINFTGSGVVATSIGNAVTVNITGGGGGGAGLDFGTFTSPAGFTLDLGSFV